MKKTKAKVAIIMGSQTDYKFMADAEKILLKFKIKSHVEVVSAHRTPDRMFEFAKSARSDGFQVIIAGAGGAAHLPGMVASLTSLPVIGIPIDVTSMKGLDALLSIAQMPKGIPVATVAVNNAENAGLLALRILASTDLKLAKALDQFASSQKLKIKKMNQEIKKNRRSIRS